MSINQYPMRYKPKVTKEGESHRITIPCGIRDELEIEKGEEPDEIEFSSDGREVTYRFGDF